VTRSPRPLLTRRSALSALAAAACVPVGCNKSEPSATPKESPSGVPPTVPQPGKGWRFYRQNPSERLAAAGALEALPTDLRKAFSPGEGFFEPMPVPKDGDWLDAHNEPGQTYDAWTTSGANLARAPKNVIELIPVGAWSDRAPTVTVLERFTRAFFGLPVRVADPVSTSAIGATSRKRSTGTQLLTTDILDWMRKGLKSDTYCALAVTTTDLYPDPGWNFVFGQARLYQRVGVFSFARHDPAFFTPRARSQPPPKALILERSLGTLAHEICHMFGMDHCVFYNCLVAGSNHQEESDRHPLHLCPVCLRKLHRGAGMTVVPRYQALASFYQQAGLAEEADWTRRRLAHVRG